MGVILYTRITDTVLPIHRAGYFDGQQNMSLTEVTDTSVLRNAMLQNNDRCLFVQEEPSAELIELIVRLAGRRTNGEYALIVMAPQTGMHDLRPYCLNMGIAYFEAIQVKEALAWVSKR